MQRTPGSQNRPPSVALPENSPSKLASPSRAVHDHVGTFWDMLGIRIVFMAVCVAAGFHFRPFSVSPCLALRRVFSSAWRSYCSSCGCGTRACAG